VIGPVSDSLFAKSPAAFVEALRQFDAFGAATVTFEEQRLRYFVNEYWTSGQRRGHSLHEISYRACFKAQLPEFLIERLSEAGDTVYDPFSGRGTTPLQAALMGRRPVANDINPLSEMLVAPRLAPPGIAALRDRLDSIPPVDTPDADEPELDAFYHPDTLRRIRGLRTWLLNRNLDAVDAWIRMVALNRLTGHSPGFFSVYTLPPNQAASVVSQRKINAARDQVPPPRDVNGIILKKTKSLLADGIPPPHPPAVLMTGAASSTPLLANGAVDLLVTSPPFLDIVDYEGDNWLRCWFAGIDPGAVKIARHGGIPAWERFVRSCFEEFARVVRPGGFIGFEVGEVRGGKVLLERHVVAAIEGLPFVVLGVMVNQQAFTKTANCWGVGNNAKGTNTNRIVMIRRV
jgi:DNA methylase